MALGEKDLGRDKNREADKEEKSRSKDKADKEEKTREERRRREAREIEARSAREKISVIGASLSGEKNLQQPGKCFFSLSPQSWMHFTDSSFKTLSKVLFPKHTKNKQENKMTDQIVATGSSSYQMYTAVSRSTKFCRCVFL